LNKCYEIVIVIICTVYFYGVYAVTVDIVWPIQHTLAVFYLSHTTKPKRYVRNIILRRCSINPTPICWYGRSRGRMQWAGLRLRPYLSTYIISVYTPVSLWKEKKALLSHVVSGQHFMTLINTQVRVVLDVTESNKNFPLIIIIIIRVPYILQQKSQGEANNIIALYYYIVIIIIMRWANG